MFVATGTKKQRKADLARLQEDGAVMTYRGRLVLSYDAKTDFNLFVKRFRYLTTYKDRWIKEGLNDLDRQFALQENELKRWMNEKGKHIQSTSQMVYTNALQHEFSKATLEKEWNHIFIRVSEQVSDQQLQQFITFLENENSPLMPTIQINVDTDYFQPSTVQLFIHLNDLAQKKGWVKPIININNLNKTNESGHDSWDIEKECANGWDIATLARANMEIDRVVEKIKKAKLSPLETVQFLNDYVSRLVTYKETTNTVYRRASSYLGAFLQKPELVCAGFSDMIVRIIEKLNMPGLSCRYLSTMQYVIDKEKNKSKAIEEENETTISYTYGSHAQIMLMIDDDKYGYHGDNFMDATWNNRGKNEWPLYAFALLPMNALQGYKDIIVREAVRDELTEKGLSRAKAMEKEERINGQIPNIDLDIVTNSRHADLTQEMCEKSIFEMYKRMYPQATLEELKDVIWHIVAEAYDKQKETFIDEVIVYYSKIPVTSDEWMQQCLAQIQQEKKEEQQKQKQAIQQEQQWIEKLLYILKKPKEQEKPQDLIDQFDLIDCLKVKAVEKEDIIKELEQRLIEFNTDWEDSTHMGE